MPLHANCHEEISPTERVRRNNTRRWSDSPMLLRDQQSHSNRAMSMSAGHELTQSLYNLSNPRIHTLSKVSSGSQINLSSTTLQSERTMSLSKSRDSGFNKSASCASLNSTNTKYSHVESKVKKYVQGIKDAEALRRKSMSTDCVNNIVPLPNLGKAQSGPVQEDKNLTLGELESKLRDKDLLINSLQGSYNDLLLKYAEAENKIDRLSIKFLHSSSTKSNQTPHPFSDDFDIAPVFFEKHKSDVERRHSHHTFHHETHEDGLEDSISFSFSDSNLPSPSAPSARSKSDVFQKEVVMSAPLGPIQKLYCTSVRLDKVLPPLGHLSPSEASKSSPEVQGYAHHLPAVAEDGAEETKDMSAEENYELVKYCPTADTALSTNIHHATTDTGIEDCVQSTTDNNATGDNTRQTASRLSFQPEQILNIPDEDAIAKVHRWRESLPDDVAAPKNEATSKPKKYRNRKSTPKRTVGVQTCTTSGNIPMGYSYDNLRSQPTALIRMAGTPDLQDSGTSPEFTDCDNCSELNRKFGRSRSPTTSRLRRDQSSPNSKPAGFRSKHQCSGECKTCGSTISARDRPCLEEAAYYGSCASPKDKSMYPKTRSGIDKAEKSAFRRDLLSPRRSVRCLRPGSSNAYLTRAVLLDMLLNAQAAHSCCCCCQHAWRGRQPTPSHSRDVMRRDSSRCFGGEESSLQRCLDEIQTIAWELKENLAASHEGLVNLVRKSE